LAGAFFVFDLRGGPFLTGLFDVFEFLLRKNGRPTDAQPWRTVET